MPRTLCICFAVFCLLFAVSAVQGADAKVFKAGAAVADITPTRLDSPTVGNYVSQKAGKVRDPITARSLVLSDGKEQIAFLVLDLCYVHFATAEKIKDLVVQRTGIPKDRIMVSATHTHSAPHLTVKAKEGETGFTCENAAGAVVEAHKNLAPAKIGWAVGNDPKNVFCRRFLMKPGTATNNPGTGVEPDRVQMNPGASPNKVSPAGPVDTLLPVLSVVSPDDKPIAVFANWSCHHAQRGLVSTELSADRFGVFCNDMKRRIAEKVGKNKMSDKFVAIMANGTSGDANCVNYLDATRKYTFEDVGRDNAAAAMVVWPNIKYFDWVPLGMKETRLKIPFFKPSPEEVKGSQEAMNGEAAKKSVTLARSLRDTVKASNWEQVKDVPVQAMRIGEFGVTTLPGEFFGITGIDLKAQSPFQPTMNIGLANASCGYVPPPEQFDLGGYECWRSTYSCLPRDAEPLVKKTLLDMLHALRAEQ